MLSRVLYSISFWLLLCLSATAFGQSDFQAGLEKFFNSRTILGELDVTHESHELCRLCRSKVDLLAPRIIEVLKDKKIVRIEGFGLEGRGVEGSMRFAEFVHSYLRAQHKIETPLYLTGYSNADGLIKYPKVEIVSYDGILPVEDAEIQTVIVR